MRGKKKHIQDRCLSEKKLRGPEGRRVKTPENQRQVPFWWFNLSQWTCLFKTTDHSVNDTTGCQIFTSQREDMIKDSTTALNNRHRQLRLPLQIQEQNYLQNSGLAQRDILSTTPIEESRPLPLIESCCGKSKVQNDGFHNPSRKASLADKMFDEFHSTLKQCPHVSLDMSPLWCYENNWPSYDPGKEDIEVELNCPLF